MCILDAQSLSKHQGRYIAKLHVARDGGMLDLWNSKTGAKGRERKCPVRLFLARPGQGGRLPPDQPAKLLVVNILCHEKGIENEESGLVVLHISILPSGD